MDLTKLNELLHGGSLNAAITCGTLKGVGVGVR